MTESSRRYPPEETVGLCGLYGASVAQSPLSITFNGFPVPTRLTVVAVMFMRIPIFLLAFFRAVSLFFADSMPVIARPSRSI